MIKSADGQTIEVLNTDAEGRLVLADALWYTQTKSNLKPLLTWRLTGAIIVALGSSRCGMFSNNDKMVVQLKKAGDVTGEPVYMPLGEVYDNRFRHCRHAKYWQEREVVPSPRAVPQALH